MRKHRAADATTHATAKTLGPFTGRQLTTIICVVVVTVLFPVTSWAVTGSPVFLTDPHNNHHAAVDANGNVSTKVNGAVTVAGGVTVNGGAIALSGDAPGNLADTPSFVQSGIAGVSNTNTSIFSAPAGRELIVTDAHLDWAHADPAQDFFAEIFVGDPGTCANGVSGSNLFWDLPVAQDSHDTQFSPGYIVPAGKAVCAAKSSVTPSVFLTLFGYSVPAGSVAGPSPQPSAVSGNARQPIPH